MNGGLRTKHESCDELQPFKVHSRANLWCYARGGECSDKSVNPSACMVVAGHRSLGLWCGLCASWPSAEKVLEIDQLASL